MENLELKTALLEISITTRARLIKLREDGVECMLDVETEAFLNGKLEGLRMAIELLEESSKGVA